MAVIEIIRAACLKLIKKIACLRKKPIEMMILQNFRIGTRLAAAFMIIIALMAAVTAVGMVELSEVTKDTRMIVQDRLVKLQLSQTIENEVNRQSRAVRTALISVNEDAIDKELEKIEDSKPLVTRALAALEQTVHTP